MKDPPLGVEAQELWLRAHVTLGRIREQQKRPADARALYERLIAYWKEAEPVPLLQEARAAAARLALTSRDGSA